MVKFTSDEIKCMALFEELTGAMVEDCIIDKDNATFLIREGDMGWAIGKNGSTLQRVKKVFNRDISVVEYSKKFEKFVTNLFSSIRIMNIITQEKDGKKIIILTIDARDRGSAIGKNGGRIKIARALLLRHFNMELKLIWKVV